MKIEAIKLKGRPLKEKKFSLSAHEFDALKKLGAVKIGGYVLKTKGKNNG